MSMYGVPSPADLNAAQAALNFDKDCMPLVKELQNSNEAFRADLSADGKSKLSMLLTRYSMILNMTSVERLHIAREYLVPKLRKEYGIEFSWILNHIG